MKNNPLVSVIVTTKNSANFLQACLESIKNQSYKNIELIVVDNNSIDDTQDIAKRYTKHLYTAGPERSAQRNLGAKKANGEYLLFIDSDMILTADVIKNCVSTIKMQKVGGIIIPEESIGDGFWAKCKKLERSYYVGNEFIEAARFFPKQKFKIIGGFDEHLTGPEDWDLSQRVKDRFGVSRIHEYILHDEGKLSLITSLKKKYYYSKKINEYIKKTDNKNNLTKQFSLIERYKIFMSQPKIILKYPLLWLGMIFMKTCEFSVGAIGYLYSKSNLHKNK
jgi:glycosyltransferase involved in cell wall biosynthesis